MDRIDLKEKITDLFQKYKYVLLVLALGLALMCLPQSEEDEVPIQQDGQTTESSTSDALEEILSAMEGVGKVRVLLTESAGAETFYQTDEDSAGDSLRVETVIISGSERGEQGLVRRVDPPVYLGAIVVCQGASQAAVRLAVVEAVSNVTGISTDRITVLKMK